jgi:hypothetical protein
MLGNHSYITTLLLYSPLVGIFQSPLVLNIIGFLNISISVVLFYYLSQRLFQNHFFSFLISLAYFLHPLSLEGAYGYLWTCFQPESQLAMGVLFFVLAVEKKSTVGLLLSVVYLLLMKEEYIPIVPVLILWSALYLKLSKNDVFFFKKRPFILLFLTFSLFTTIVILTLRHYQSLITYQHVRTHVSLLRPAAWLAFLTNGSVSWSLPATTLYTGFPLVVTILLIFRKPKKTLFFLVATLFLFVYLRLLTDRFFYGNQLHSFASLSPGLAWANWARAIIPPAVFVGILWGVKLAEIKSEKKLWMIGSACLLSTILINIKQPPIGWQILNGKRALVDQTDPDFSQKKEIAAKLPPPKGFEVIMFPNSSWEFFLHQRSLLQYHRDYINDLISAKHFENWLAQTDYVILPTDKINAQVKTAFKDFRPVCHTQNYILFERIQKLSPRIYKM